MNNEKSCFRRGLIDPIYGARVILLPLLLSIVFGCAHSIPTREVVAGIDPIEQFLIVQPEEHVFIDIRRELVETATRFLGVPYSRGGESTKDGFDCSGLTMAVYHLNGLKLPRESARQFRVGRHVERHDLQIGDLVFFATEGGPRVTHVGLYIGSDKFIHAPRPGKTVRISSLNSVYFQRRYVGGRSYF